MTEAEVEALLAAAYARSVGVEGGSVDDLVAAMRAAEVSAEALAARRAALRRVEARCIVSRVQGAFLDRVLAV